MYGSGGFFIRKNPKRTDKCPEGSLARVSEFAENFQFEANPYIAWKKRKAEQ